MDTMENYLLLVDAHIARLNAAMHMERYPWSNGWMHEWTGGNCDGYRLNAGGGYYMVTHDAGCPITETEWSAITLAYYIGDDIAGDHIEDVHNWETLVRFFTLPNGGR